MAQARCFPGHFWPQIYVVSIYVAYSFQLDCPYSLPPTPLSHSNSPESKVLDTLHQRIWSCNFNTFSISRNSSLGSPHLCPALMLRVGYLFHQYPLQYFPPSGGSYSEE